MAQLSNQQSEGAEERAGRAGDRFLRPEEAAEPGSRYRPDYVNSWALVIGINDYRDPDLANLDYAVDDAAGMAELLIGQLGFDRERVFVILDPPPVDPSPSYKLAGTEATKDVLEEWLFTRLADGVGLGPDEVGLGPDDRVLVFFAGHGESRKQHGNRYKGYLVPANGRAGAWHTLIAMDDVIEAGDFYEAKHVFYLVDACFSGLALARSGIKRSRFEAGMLTARARQALTAGTAKQTVADRGPGGHSLFTSFLLQGLGGEAAQENTQVITASDLMLYVRNRVASQVGSRQTPDFGKLPGHEYGGDFLFRLPAAAPPTRVQEPVPLPPIERPITVPEPVPSSAELEILLSPLVEQTYEYTFMLRAAGGPGLPSGARTPEPHRITKRDRDQMLDLVNQITHAVNVTLTRQFEREAGERGARLDLEEPLRPAAQPQPANHRAYSVSVEDLLRSTGDLMVRLLLPVPTQGHLQRIDGSISITTNDVELPWELLYDRGQVLSLKNPVARMPMGRAFPRAGRTPVRVDGRSRMLLIYADPEANLPTAEAEVDLIREALVSGFGDKVLIDVWKGQDAEGRALTDALRFGSYDVIHYAGHADFDVEDPVLSGLLLHDGERFAAQKIGRLLEGRPLFYLNACETGRVASEERPQGVFRYAARLVEGLASALIPRGALGCIGALWTIYDRPAAEFAVDFYRRLLEGQTTGEAIRQARLESKSRYPEQITWASPVLYGDPTHRLVV